MANDEGDYVLDKIYEAQREQIGELQAEIEGLKKRLDGLLSRSASIKCPKCGTIIKAV